MLWFNSDQKTPIIKEDIRDLLSKDQAQRLELKESPDKGVYVKVKEHFSLLSFQFL